MSRKIFDPDFLEKNLANSESGLYAVRVNFEIKTSPASKTSITISRQQLGINFVTSWANMVSVDPTVANDLKPFEEALNALCVGPLDNRIRKLFKRGDTYPLMRDLTDYIDLPTEEKENTLIEIIVTDGPNKLKIYHRDIAF